MVITMVSPMICHCSVNLEVRVGSLKLPTMGPGEGNGEGLATGEGDGDSEGDRDGDLEGLGGLWEWGGGENGRRGNGGLTGSF